MRILILNWRDPKNPKAGGAEYVTLKHASAWVKAGHEVDWFTSQFAGSKKKEIIDGVTIFRKGNSVTVLLYAPFYYLFSGRKYDVIIDEIHGIPFFTPFYVRKKKIAFIHEVAGDIWNYMFPFPLNKLGLFLELYSLKLYRNIQFMTVSESTKDELNKIGIMNVSVVHNGIDSKVLHFNKESSPTFVFISRLVKMKGVEDVIKAFKYISEHEQNAVLWILGDGERSYVDSLKRMVRELNLDRRVRFWGKVSDLKKNELLRKAHILLHASRKEGWGLVVLEAAIQETPSVVYNVPGLRDAVKNNETGIIIKNNNPVLLGESAYKLFKNKQFYTTIQRKAQKRAKTFMWKYSVMKSLTLIES